MFIWTDLGAECNAWSCKSESIQHSLLGPMAATSLVVRCVPHGAVKVTLPLSLGEVVTVCGLTGTRGRRCWGSEAAAEEAGGARGLGWFLGGWFGPLHFTLRRGGSALFCWAWTPRSEVCVHCDERRWAAKLVECPAVNAIVGNPIRLTVLLGACRIGLLSREVWGVTLCSLLKWGAPSGQELCCIKSKRSPPQAKAVGGSNLTLSRS